MSDKKIIPLTGDKIVKRQIRRAIDGVLDTGKPQFLTGELGVEVCNLLDTLKSRFEELPEEEKARRRASVRPLTPEQKLALEELLEAHESPNRPQADVISINPEKRNE